MGTKPETALVAKKVKKAGKACNVLGSGHCHCFKNFIDVYKSLTGIETPVCVAHGVKEGSHSDLPIHGAHVDFGKDRVWLIPLCQNHNTPGSESCTSLKDVSFTAISLACCCFPDGKQHSKDACNCKSCPEKKTHMCQCWEYTISDKAWKFEGCTCKKG